MATGIMSYNRGELEHVISIGRLRIDSILPERRPVRPWYYGSCVTQNSAPIWLSTMASRLI